MGGSGNGPAKGGGAVHIVTQQRDISLRRSYPAQLLAASQARQEVALFAAGLHREVMEKAQLVVTELITNSVQHSGTAPFGTIDLELRASGSALHGSVTDSGPGFDPGSLGPPPEGAEGGWGLHIMRELADRWGVERGSGSRVWFELVPRSD
jgi:anti-sigma regulatory factor (Ser/Thr protein kinase)